MKTVLREDGILRLVHYESRVYRRRPSPVLLQAWDKALAHLKADHDGRGQALWKATAASWAAENPNAAGIVSVQDEEETEQPRFFGVANGLVTKAILPSALATTARAWMSADYQRGWLAGYEAGVRRAAEAMRQAVMAAVADVARRSTEGAYAAMVESVDDQEGISHVEP